MAAAERCQIRFAGSTREAVMRNDKGRCLCRPLRVQKFTLVFRSRYLFFFLFGLFLVAFFLAALFLAISVAPYLEAAEASRTTGALAGSRASAGTRREIVNFHVHREQLYEQTPSVLK